MSDAADFYTGFVADAYAVLRGHTFDAERYARFVRENGEPGLEVGCGDGHPLLDLVASGLDVDGVDSSPDMIQRAEAARDARGLRSTLTVARMEHMDLGRRYRSIYLAGPTFELLPDDAAAAAALAAFSRHLTPGGTVLIPLWIPGPTDPAELGRARIHRAEDGTELRYQALTEATDPRTRTRRTAVRYERARPGSPLQVIEREWVIHWHTPTSLAELAASAGLRVARWEDAPAQPQPGDEFAAYLSLA